MQLYIFNYLSEFTKIYKRLDIQDLVDRGESFYNEMMGKIVKKLQDQGETTFSDEYFYFETINPFMKGNFNIMQLKVYYLEENIKRCLRMSTAVSLYYTVLHIYRKQFFIM